MRTRQERIIHALFYEIFALLSISLLLKPLFQLEMSESLTIGLAFSIYAVVWNLIFNYVFDTYLLKHHPKQLTQRSLKIRIIHALGFEGSMLVLTLPMLAWWLNVSMFEALRLELFLVIYITLYTFVYNYLYDIISPPKIR
ncbi:MULTISPECIES: PACE efflux transporter [unclassified Pseudoalteromonas]|uniref:PACE efflux transporter n=1 Tax=unclassified Pseudoalteromonas TaxID=194690 RepID=UPI002097D200|nr:PACE efflux transporter [Pseudoalteromonas sp. XMcav2-N]MCO7188627.1 PACE efflux transporter [Pseudoalteromonas sp. XMcav2-N]